MAWGLLLHLACGICLPNGGSYMNARAANYTECDTTHCFFMFQYPVFTGIGKQLPEYVFGHPHAIGRSTVARHGTVPGPIPEHNPCGTLPWYHAWNSTTIPKYNTIVQYPAARVQYPVQYSGHQAQYHTLVTLVQYPGTWYHTLVTCHPRSKPWSGFLTQHSGTVT